MQFQSYCNVHEYGWSIEEDGIAYGCPGCEEDIDEVADDPYWRKVDEQYEEHKYAE